VIAAVRIALGVLGVLFMIAGGIFMRLGQHQAHVERAAGTAREAHERIDRVRDAARRLYAALDEPDGVFRTLATARVKNVGQQIGLMHDAAEAMAVARRDFVAAAAAYRDVTQTDLGGDEKRVAHADDLFVDAFVETRRMVERIATHPKEAGAFRNARDRLQTTLGNAMSEYRSARDAVVADMRTGVAATRSRAEEADRETERLRSQTTKSSFLNP
jgi:hypothetical protein